jgi:hypothetical protein
MKFFMPQIQNPEQAEEKYQAIKAVVQKTVSYEISDRRIFRIEFTDNRTRVEAEVGKIIRIDRPEVVVAIFESSAYLICTASRGIHGNIPIFVGLQEASKVEDFEA